MITNNIEEIQFQTIQIEENSPISVLPNELLQKIFLHLGFTNLQKTSCVNENWTVLSVDVAKKLEFQLFQDFVFSLFITLDDSYSEEISSILNLIDCYITPKIKQLTVSETEAAKVQNFLSLLEVPFQTLSIDCLLDLELFLSESAYQILNILTSRDPDIIDENKIPESIKWLFSHVDREEPDYLTGPVVNCVINYSKLLALKNEYVVESIDYIKTVYPNSSGLNEKLALSLANCNEFQKAIKVVNYCKDFKIFAELTKKIVSKGHDDIALSWALSQNNYKKKDAILLAILLNSTSKNFAHTIEILNQITSTEVIYKAFSETDGILKKIRTNYYEKLENIDIALKFSIELKNIQFENTFFSKNINDPTSINFRKIKNLFNEYIFKFIIKNNTLDEALNKIKQTTNANGYDRDKLLWGMMPLFIEKINDNPTENLLKMFILVNEINIQCYKYNNVNKHEFLKELKDAYEHLNQEEFGVIWLKHALPEEFMVKLMETGQFDKLHLIIDSIPKQAFIKLCEISPSTLYEIALKYKELADFDKVEELAYYFTDVGLKKNILTNLWQRNYFSPDLENAWQKHNSPEDYVVHLLKNGLLEELLSIIDTVSPRAFTELLNRGVLMQLAIKLAANGRVDIARKIAKLLPNAQASLVDNLCNKKS